MKPETKQLLFKLLIVVVIMAIVGGIAYAILQSPLIPGGTGGKKKEEENPEELGADGTNTFEITGWGTRSQLVATGNNEGNMHFPVLVLKHDVGNVLKTGDAINVSSGPLGVLGNRKILEVVSSLGSSIGNAIVLEPGGIPVTGIPVKGTAVTGYFSKV